MRVATPHRAFFIAVGVLLACASGNGARAYSPGATAAPALPSVRIAEFHYDNVSTDAGEAIEISGPAGTSLTGWQIVLYNGAPASRATYDTKLLSGAIPATCGARGVVVQTYLVNGIQNGGDPDGLALVDSTGAVVEFLSYEGAFTAANGPAAGMTSVDIGVAELGTEPAGLSLQRDGNGNWSGPTAHTFGSCNDEDTAPAAEVASVTVTPGSATIVENATRAFAALAYDANGQTVAGTTFTWTTSDPSVATVTPAGIATGVSAGDATITATTSNGKQGSATLHVDDAPTPPGPPVAQFSEIHYDNTGTDANEAIEIEGPAGTDLTGWSVVLYNGSDGKAYNTRLLSAVIPATCGGRGVLVLTYPENGIQNGAAGTTGFPDAFALVDQNGQPVEFLSYEGVFTALDGPAAGLASTDIGAAQNGSIEGLSLQRYAATQWSLAQSTFGLCNGTTPPVTANAISITGRSGSDPALPVGFQDQLFATLRSSTGVAIATTFTWSSDLPLLASIDPLGVVTALADGTAVLRATAADGTTGTIALPTRVAVASSTALYVGNAAFGEPGDADPTDDFIVRYPQFVASFNPGRGTPNWVSYELDPTHYGAEDRCDCFTFDPDLPAAFNRYTTADYTGAGAFHGYGIDRGHLTRSFDRTSGSLDNARTFYFTNIVPQAAELNQGPWADFENYLGDLARTAGKEVYIVTGVAGNKGTIKNEGKIVIPSSTWKVAVIMPHDQGPANVVDYRDLEVIAVNMPNETGIRTVPWETYETTVDAIEGLTGYDLLAVLNDKVENIVESGTKPPFAVSDGPYSSSEGGVVSMSAVGSFDTNGNVTAYAWSFGDGTGGTGATVNHTYVQDGTYTVTLTVMDADGLTDTITTTASIGNVAPSLAAIAGATNLLPGELFVSSVNFTDPGADSWTATIDYGDGGGTTSIGAVGKTFPLSHTYQSAGIFTVTVAVTDDTVTSVGATTVTVITASDAIGGAITGINAIAGSGHLSANLVRSLEVKLTGALKNVQSGDVPGALEKLQSAIDQLDALVRAGRLSADSAAPIRALLTRTMASLAR